MSHRVCDLRSLALHRAVAERLDDAMVATARARLPWMASRGTAALYVAQWADLLDGPRPELTAALVRDDETMATLRTASPFAGALPPRVRWAVLAAAPKQPR